MKTYFTFISVLLFSLLSRAAERSPNVVFILADDLGWADTTLYGHTNFYRTPNIAKLAKRGITFTNAYSASPLCSPTRAAILTGLSPARTGLTAPHGHLPTEVLKAQTTATAPPNRKSTTPNSVSRLDTRFQTIAKSLKKSGYTTGHFGKWHLGPEPWSPLEHGFDVDIPHYNGPGPRGSFVAPWAYGDFRPNSPKEHIEDRMASEAVAWMEKHKEKPFFLNYWMFSVHAPFDAKKPLVKKYRASVDTSDEQRCPTYAAMVETMDDAVGTLIDALDRLKLTDNTIIIFTSDNGGNCYNWVERERPTSNRPLRGGKATIYEGGVRVPCVIVWPEKTTPDTRSNAIIQSEDFYPTVLKSLGIKPAPSQIFDGIDISPALRGKPIERNTVFQYFPHNPPVPDWLPPAIAVRSGDWKLIRIFHGGEAGAHDYQLFNIKEDLGEAKNLAETHPEKVTELDTKIEAFLVDTKAIRPLPNPKFDPSKYDPKKIGIPKGKNAIRPPAKK
ncbi:MAG: sulfatase [Akkermansiaceae bacterium]